MSNTKRVLAVDDDSTNLSIVRESIGDFCELLTVSDGETAIRAARDFRPHVVLVDIMMPHVDGYEVCRRIREDIVARHCRIILVSAKSDVADRLKGYQAGADDYLTKPFFEEELIAKVNVAFNTKGAEEFSIVQQRVERLCHVHGQSLAIISQLRDSEDGTHLANVRAISHILAAELRKGSFECQIDDDFLDRLDIASVLHDVGKMSLPDRLLNERSDWSDEDREQLKEHTVIGERILNHLAQQHANVSVYRMAAIVARWHHECFDGSGYPDGLKGTRIPLAARIVKLADVFDTRVKSWDTSYPSNTAAVRAQLHTLRGAECDPVIVDALLNVFDEITDLYCDETFVEKLDLIA